MKNILRASLLASALLLAGCCANNVCNCDDLFADALYFKFDRKFTSADIDTVYLFRYAAADTVRWVDSTAILAQQPQSVLTKLKQYSLDSTYVLSNTLPFSPGTTGKLSQYSYKFRLRAGNSRKGKVYSYRIANIITEGRYAADGCCTCYENTRKNATVNKAPKIVTETQGRPVVIPLVK